MESDSEAARMIVPIRGKMMTMPDPSDHPADENSDPIEREIVGLLMVGPF
ncbi:MAG: hypothetical protein M1274_06700 [Actinobacteria bacterium]|nr:hypothetical protein [Actinomycetota bacterium]